VKPDDYWKANNSVRKGAKKISKILETGAPWVIERENPIGTNGSLRRYRTDDYGESARGGDNSPFDGAASL